MVGTWIVCNLWEEYKWWGLTGSERLPPCKHRDTREIYLSFFSVRQQKKRRVSVCEQRLEKLLQSTVMKEASLKRKSLLMI